MFNVVSNTKDEMGDQPVSSANTNASSSNSGLVLHKKEGFMNKSMFDTPEINKNDKFLSEEIQYKPLSNFFSLRVL